MYVIMRSYIDGGGYVSIPGSAKSYIKSLTRAQVYRTREDAERNCCSNESVVSVESILKENIK